MRKSGPIANTYSGRNLHGQVVHELGRRIVGGTYAVESALPNEEELCRELGVSRTALREAVKVLAAKGLVESRPRIGTRVRIGEAWNMLDPDVLAWRCSTLADAQFVQHLSEMRQIIEPAAAALAARNRTQGQLRDIEEACAAMAASKTIDEWVAADLDFHAAILSATNNPLLRPLAAMIATALVSMSMSPSRRGDFKLGLSEHTKVLDAIRRQDAAAAVRRMNALLFNTHARLLSLPANPTRKRIAAAGTA